MWPFGQITPPLGEPEPNQDSEHGEWTLAVGEPIVGLRLWRVENVHGVWTLTGIWMRVRWPGRSPLKAAHYDWVDGKMKPRNYLPNSQRCDAPRLLHTCGIHTVKTDLQLKAWRKHAAEGNAFVPGRPGIVWAQGEASLWGRVVRHEGGARAEYAYPRNITLVVDRGAQVAHIVEALAARYGVPVEVRELVRDIE